MSCDSSEDVGGHYFEGMDSDPWTTTYTPDDYGVSQVSFEMEDFSLHGDYPVSGRAVVIHAEDGTRVACGLLSGGEAEIATLKIYPEYPPEHEDIVLAVGTVSVSDVEAGGILLEASLSGLEQGRVANLGLYPDYDGDISVSGIVSVTDSEEGIQLEGSLSGLERNSHLGGIHIHSGMSCDSSEDVGGHYFEGMDSDPWTTTYTPDDYGVSQVSFEMEDFSLHGDYPVSGRAVVIHAVDGTRVACGLLEPAVCEVCSTRRQLLFGNLPADCC